MRRDDSVRKRSGDWPSYDRTDRPRPSSPKGSFVSRGEGGSRQGYEASWSSRFDTDPKQSSDKQLGGWREPPRSGRQDLASASNGWSEMAIKQSSSGLEGSERVSDGWANSSDSLSGGWGKITSSSVRWGDTPRSPIVPPPSIAPTPSRAPSSVPPPPSHPHPALPSPLSSLPRPQGPQSRAGEVSTPPGTSVTKPEEAQRSSTDRDKVTTGLKSTVHVPGDRRKHYWNRLACVVWLLLTRKILI